MMCNRNCFWVWSCTCLACFMVWFGAASSFGSNSGALGPYCVNLPEREQQRPKSSPDEKPWSQILRTERIISGTASTNYIMTVNLSFHSRICILCMVSKVAVEKESHYRRSVIVETLAEYHWVGWMFSINGVQSLYDKEITLPTLKLCIQLL